MNTLETPYEAPSATSEAASKQDAQRVREIADLRTRIAEVTALIDWLEATPGAPVPSLYSIHTMNAYVDTSEEFAAAARSIGKCEKHTAGDAFFYLRKQFGSVQYEVNIARQNICRKIEETIEVPEEIIPAHTKKVTRWECPESILAGEPA